MYSKPLKTNTGEFIDINIPECCQDVNMGMVIAIMPYIMQLAKADYDVEVNSPFEMLAVITGLPIDDLYSSLMPADALGAVNWYAEAALHYIYTVPDQNYTPKFVKVRYNGKNKNVNIKHLSIYPVGAYVAVKSIIDVEMNKCIAEYGPDDWQQNFSPSFDACAQLVDQFLYCRVTREAWKDDLVDTCDFANQLSVPDCLYIAKYFFNAWPELNWAGVRRKAFWKRLFF